MAIFLERHQQSLLGVIGGFDRITFKGYLTSMFPYGAFARYLHRGACCSRMPGSFRE